MARSSRWRRRLLAATLGAICVATGTVTGAADREADLEALAAFHDFSVPEGWTRLYLKQAAIDRVRRHLADAGRELKLGPGWTREAPQWREAEGTLVDALFDAGVRELGDEAWFRQTWRRESAEVLDASQVAGVLERLREPPGPHLAATMDWFIGELVMTRLTFTDRIRMNTPGLEGDVARVRQVSDEKLGRMRFDYGPYPQAQLFIWHDPGRRYFRDVGFRIVARLNARLDSALAAQQAAFAREAPRADAYLESFRLNASPSR